MDYIKCIKALKIMFIRLDHQEFIVHENVKWKKVLFQYYLSFLFNIFV